MRRLIGHWHNCWRTNRNCAGTNIAELRAMLATERRARKEKDLSRDEVAGNVGCAIERLASVRNFDDSSNLPHKT